jgi:hypothetical protein
VRPVNRFVRLSSEMAIDGDVSTAEPRTVKEALERKDRVKWLASMEAEIENIEFGKGLESLGFKRTESDWGLYYLTKTRDRGPALLLAYVDDIVVAAETRKEIDEVMKGLSRRWKVTELGEISTPCE